MSVAGADSYTWQPGNKTGDKLSLTATTMGIKTFTVYGANATGGVGSQAISINVVMTPPTTTVSPISTTICPGDSITLKATGLPIFTFGTQANQNSNIAVLLVYDTQRLSFSKTIFAFPFINGIFLYFGLLQPMVYRSGK